METAIPTKKFSTPVVGKLNGKKIYIKTKSQAVSKAPTVVHKLKLQKQGSFQKTDQQQFDPPAEGCSPKNLMVKPATQAPVHRGDEKAQLNTLAMGGFGDVIGVPADHLY